MWQKFSNLPAYYESLPCLSSGFVGARCKSLKKWILKKPRNLREWVWLNQMCFATHDITWEKMQATRKERNVPYSLFLSKWSMSKQMFSKCNAYEALNSMNIAFHNWITFLNSLQTCKWEKWYKLLPCFSVAGFVTATGCRFWISEYFSFQPFPANWCIPM